jgi:hypothetical protein
MSPAGKFFPTLAAMALDSRVGLKQGRSSTFTSSKYEKSFVNSYSFFSLY